MRHFQVVQECNIVVEVNYRINLNEAPYCYNIVLSLGPPGRPGGPLEVTDVKKDSVKLKWKKPEDDGGKPIT